MGISKEEIQEVYTRPLFSLVSQAHHVHCQHHRVGEVQICSLLSYKTGGCTEDCKYCAQSSRYQTSVSPLPLLQKKAMLACAERAIEKGASRICIGAAWREVREGKAFETILEVVEELAEKGIEVCVTLGMLTEAQAKRLADAGLFAYNHNLDTSPEYYEKIISTRNFSDRLKTLEAVGKAGVQICTGGILGMGETEEDRISLLHALVNLPIPPESVPLNFLMPIPGTPLEDQPPLPIWEMVRMIAAARLFLPTATIRLAAGRIACSQESQALCFFAGANSLFSGEILLTEPNPSFSDDDKLFTLLGLTPRG
ncbi:MAG: Biotin synthase [Chlamydiae bacterium]|nr:Biotin synthase [Chlamydiota bacterium]